MKFIALPTFIVAAGMTLLVVPATANTQHLRKLQEANEKNEMALRETETEDASSLSMSLEMAPRSSQNSGFWNKESEVVAVAESNGDASFWRQEFRQFPGVGDVLRAQNLCTGRNLCYARVTMENCPANFNNVPNCDGSETTDQFCFARTALNNACHFSALDVNTGAGPNCPGDLRIVFQVVTCSNAVTDIVEEPRCQSTPLQDNCYQAINVRVTGCDNNFPLCNGSVMVGGRCNGGVNGGNGACLGLNNINNCGAGGNGDQLVRVACTTVPGTPPTPAPPVVMPPVVVMPPGGVMPPVIMMVVNPPSSSSSKSGKGGKRQ